jgi:hypothetical protein
MRCDEGLGIWQMWPCVDHPGDPFVDPPKHRGRAFSSKRSAAAITVAGGVGHPGGDFAGSSDVLRGEDATEFRDQRFLGGGRKAAPGANFQPFDLSRTTLAGARS